MATSTYLRRVNQRRVLESVVRLRTASRAELARASGMSQPTVSRIVDQLLSQGILMESGNSEHGLSPEAAPRDKRVGVGRPSTPLELDRRRPRFALIRVGVHQTNLAALPIAIPSADQWTQSFDTPADPDLWSRRLAAAWERCKVSGLKAVVITLPGVVDETTGRVLLSPNLRWTERADLGSVLKGIFRNDHVLFAQEIRALALGHLAVERDAGDFLLVDSGSGLGAAAVAGGQLYTGPLPLSGELGHIPVLGNTRPCGCGSIGCVETLLSRTGLLASAVEHGLPDDWATFLRSLQGRPIPRWLKKSLDSGAITVAAALNVLGLRQVVFTGSFSDLPQSCIEYLNDRIRADAMWARFGSVTCRVVARHRQAGMVSRAIEQTILAPREAARFAG